eukprot:EG_transcript_988
MQGRVALCLDLPGHQFVVASTTALHHYEWREEPAPKAAPDDGPVQSQPFRLLSTVPLEAGTVQCISWCPLRTALPVLALGFGTGQVQVVELCPEGTLRLLAYSQGKPQRSCTCLAWNPMGGENLAAGFDFPKSKGTQPGITVWDFGEYRFFKYLKVAAEGGLAPRGAADDLKHTVCAESLEKPDLELAEGDAVTALDWLPGSTSQLVACCTTSGTLRRFDVKPRPQAAATQASGASLGTTRCLASLCFSPFHRDVLACCTAPTEATAFIEVWDVWQEQRLTQVVQGPRRLTGLQWSPYDPGLLASSAADDPCLRLWSISLPLKEPPETLPTDQGYESGCETEAERCKKALLRELRLERGVGSGSFVLAKESRKRLQRRPSRPAIQIQLVQSDGAEGVVKLELFKEVPTGDTVAAFGWLMGHSTPRRDQEAAVAPVDGLAKRSGAIFNFVSVNSSSTVRCLRVFRPPPFCWDARNLLHVCADRPEFHTLAPFQQPDDDPARAYDETGTLMMMRLKLGLGMDALHNVSVAQHFSDEAGMQLWYFVAIVKRLQEHRTIEQSSRPGPGPAPVEFIGLTALVEGEKWRDVPVEFIGLTALVEGEKWRDVSVAWVAECPLLRRQALKAGEDRRGAKSLRPESPTTTSPTSPSSDGSPPGSPTTQHPWLPHPLPKAETGMLHQRRLVLALCGWSDISSRRARFLPFPIPHLDTRNSLLAFARTVSIRIFTGDLAAAVALLSDIDVGGLQLGGRPCRDDNCNFQLLALALSSLTTSGGIPAEQAAHWQRLVARLEGQPHIPAYLRRAMQYLTAGDTHDALLGDEALHVLDRLAFACCHLKDAPLRAWIRTTHERLVSSGSLAGLLFCGLNAEGLGLLQDYVDRTADVQIAALLFTFFPAPNDDRPGQWVTQYRDLLDRWAAFEDRCKLDIALQSMEAKGPAALGGGGAAPSPRPPQPMPPATRFPAFRPFQNRPPTSTSPTTLGPPGEAEEPKPKALVSAPRNAITVRCSHCNHSILAGGAQGGVHGHGPAGRVTFGAVPSGKAKPTLCPHCRKSLPRCAVCLLPFGLTPHLAGTDAFGGWFSWCVRCGHGGHAAHLRDWFEGHDECPVSQCSCQCMERDRACVS